MNNLDKLISQCPCPVKMDAPGLFCFGYLKRGLTPQCPTSVVVSDQLTTNYAKFSTLAHELAHAKCWLAGCKCMSNPNHTNREYHAFKSQLERCMGYKRALRFTVTHINRISSTAFIRDMPQYKGHYTACKRLKRTKLWRQALALI